MKLGLGLYGNMLNQQNFRFARQAGATHIVAHLVGNFNTDESKNATAGLREQGFGLSVPTPDSWTYEWMRDLRKAVNAEGLELEAIENFEPGHWYDVLLDGPKKHEQMEHLKQIIRDMGRAGIPTLGYNFSIAGVWGRTEGSAARGLAGTIGFHAPEQPPIPNGMVWNMVVDPQTFDPEGRNGTIGTITQEQLWSRFTWFMQELLPVAERKPTSVWRCTPMTRPCPRCVARRAWSINPASIRRCWTSNPAATTPWNCAWARWPR